MSISAGILQEPVDFTVTVNKKTIWHKLGLRKNKRVFKIYPLCLGTLLLVAKELSRFQDFIPDNDSVTFDSVINGITKNADILSRVVAIAIWNKKKSNNNLIRRLQEKRIKSISEYIEGNLDSSEILVLSNAVIRQMEIEHFLACMGSIRGMEIVKDQSHLDPKEIYGG